MRPYISLGIEDLETLFANQQGDPCVLTQLTEELSHRQTKRARILLSRVAERLAGFEPDSDSAEDGQKEVSPPDEDDVSPPSEMPEKAAGKDERPTPIKAAHDVSGNLFGSASEGFEQPPDDREKPRAINRMRPVGTKGLPSPWERELDTTLHLEPATEPVDRYVVGLTALISELRRSGGRKRYELEQGQRVDEAGAEAVYKFAFTDDADLFQDAKVEVEVEGRRIEGSIVAIQPGELILSLKTDLGLTVPRAVLVVDDTALLEALKDRLAAVKKGEIQLNIAMANAAVGAGTPPKAQAEIPDSGPQVKLNPSQAKARAKALGGALTYIWGPPGCGKTYTLAEIVRTAFDAGRRILICSNTNKAVDQVLYRICNTLGIGHPALQEGRVVRLGRIADDKLEKEFSDYVSVEGIVARLSRTLEDQRRQLQDDIARIDTRSAAARRVLELFARLDLAERQVTSLQDSVNKAAREGKALLGEIARTQARIGELETELGSKGKLFGLLKRNPEVIQRDIAAERAKLTKLEGDAARAKLSYTELRSRFDQATAERDAATSQCARHDRSAAQAAVELADNDRAPLVAELREIEEKIADIQAAIVKQAQILGATTTKAYLSVKEIGQVDMVIIDEGSMVLLPMVWFAAGMAKQQAIICGDFRQIPPILPTRQQAIFDILGQDIFSAAGLDHLDANDGRMVMLDTQRRMDAEICRLISEPMYEGLLRTDPDVELWATRSAKAKPPSPFDGALTIVDTSDIWPFESVTPFFSRFNLMHALLVRNLAWHFADQGYVRGKKDLGVCTPYSAQAKLISNLLEGDSLGNVQVGTVHAFQGDERNVMVLELPEGHGGGKMLGQFVQGVPPRQTGARLINVAVSRAEGHLIVLANLTHLDKLLPSTALLRGILFDMQERGRVVSGAEVLRLRPIDRDLKGLLGKVDLDLEATEFGLFNQSTFESAIETDIKSAEQSIVIFSGFVTPGRVAKLGDLLRYKIAEGVKVRCVTRPPHLNGTMDPELGRQALNALEGIGCTVDCRARIHEKVVVVDRKVVWHGSLNVLSHTHRTDESMTRIVNSGFAQAVAAAMAKRPHSVEKALQTLTDAENPRCPDCGARSYYNEGRYGPYFCCEADCGWHKNLKDSTRSTNPKANEETGKTPKKGPPCPKCGGQTRLISGPYGHFYGCARYPECDGKVKEHVAHNKAKSGRKQRTTISKD